MSQNLVGGVGFKIPNVSYCKDVKDVHFNPYNLIEFYVGDITGTTPQTVNIYTDNSTSVYIEVSEGNKWYSYLLPKDKGLFRISGDSVKKVVVKADIALDGATIIPSSTVEASFKGSNTSKLTSIGGMFDFCSSLKSLDLSGWDISKVTNMNFMFSLCTSLMSLDLSGWDMSKVTDMTNMFYGCASLTTIRMKGCNKTTIDKITAVKPSSASITTE